MNSMETVQDGVKEYLVPFYNRYPVAVVKGKDHWVWDVNNRKYLDLMAGLAVVSFGHANRKIAAAVSKQLNTISHISNLFIIPKQVELSKKICSIAFKGKCFFCNSGAEANETALKIARLWGNKQAQGKNRVLSIRNSFHGRTIATLTLTGQDKYKKGLDPLLDHVDFVEYNDIRSLESQFNDSVCAIYAEAIQAEGGIYGLSREFVEKTKALAKKHNALVIFDEVQTGIGRTGKYFGYQNYDIDPDIITMAKALGNGFPIGAALVRDGIAETMEGGMHASTFGGNYLACASGLAVMDILNDDLLGKIQDLSTLFTEKLEALQTDYEDMIKEVRIFGLLIGIDLYEKYSVVDVINKLIDKSVLTVRCGKNVLRLLPPFTIGEAEIDLFMTKFKEALDEIRL